MEIRLNSQRISNKSSYLARNKMKFWLMSTAKVSGVPSAATKASLKDLYGQRDNIKS